MRATPRRISFWSLVVMLLAAAVTFPEPTAAQASAERLAYYLCFEDDFGVSYCNIFLTAPDGSRSPINIGDGYGPAWSPDGSRIVFTGYSQPGLFVLNLRNWSVTRISDVSNGIAAWSPDGTKIAVPGEQWDLLVMNSDGTQSVQLTSNVTTWGPSWSPDGSTIAFRCALETSNADICAINADGTGFRRLTFDPAEDSEPAYSPDGTLIAFQTRRFSPRPKIAVMNPNGTGVSVVGTNVEGMEPTWSPDGTQLAFVRFTCDAGNFCTYDVAIMDRDGTDVRGIAPGFSPAWTSSVYPAASFTHECTGFDCSLDGSVSWPGSSPITNYAWDFGDGTNGSGTTVNHTYPSGIYRVTLTVTDETGATATRSQDVYVSGNLLPIPRFTYQCSALRCTFDGSSSSDPDGSILYYAWWNGETNIWGPTFTYTYSSAGPFTVTLSVTDNEGGTRSTSQVITLTPNTRPVASFAAACTELVCTFDGSASSDSDGTITSYAWNFGDGSTAVGMTANHTYPWPGVFTVTLVVTDNIGDTDDQTTTLTPQQFVHIGDMDGQSSGQQNTWTARVILTMHRMTHAWAADVFVNGSWSIGGTATCQSGSNGRCIVDLPNIPRKTRSVTFTINSVTGPRSIYVPAANHDPDGDSNGISYTVGNP